jgi:hypothetical protein
MFQISRARLSWVWFISTPIWLFEKFLFYLKLAFAYRNLTFIDDVTFGGAGLTVFDVGANKGQSVSFSKKFIQIPKLSHLNPPKKPLIL